MFSTSTHLRSGRQKPDCFQAPPADGKSRQRRETLSDSSLDDSNPNNETMVVSRSSPPHVPASLIEELRNWYESLEETVPADRWETPGMPLGETAELKR